MADFNTSKVDGNTVSASEWNQLASLDNLIITSGQTPSTGNLNQMGIASARYSSGGQFFTDSGTADNYVLSPVSPFKAPVSATEGYFVGMTIRFRAGNAGTGGAAIVNVNGAGVKSLKEADGTTNPSSIPTTEDTEWRYDGTVFRKVSSTPTPATESVAGVALLPKPITIANNATDPNNDIDFSAGNFQFSDGSGQAVATAMTKRLDATWTAGTNQGGLFSGSKANSTWYHCFAIYNPTSDVSDCGFDTSVIATNRPAGYTKYKRVGSIRTNASGNILPFTQNEKDFILAVPIKDIDGAATISATLNTLTAPLGVKVFVIFDLYAISTAPIYYGLLTSPSQTDTIPSADNQNAFVQGTINVQTQKRFSILTNESSQIRSRWTGSTDITQKIFTSGWIDYQL